MTGAKLILDSAVILRALVFVFNQQADRRTGCLALEHAGQDLYLVWLIALRRMATTAGTPPVQVNLDIVLRQLHPWRATVDNTTQRRPMALAKCRHRKNSPEAVTRHR